MRPEVVELGPTKEDSRETFTAMGFSKHEFKTLSEIAAEEVAFLEANLEMSCKLEIIENRKISRCTAPAVKQGFCQEHYDKYFEQLNANPLTS